MKVSRDNNARARVTLSGRFMTYAAVVKAEQ